MRRETPKLIPAFLCALRVSAVHALLLLPIVDDGTDFGSKFFLHALHDGILLGSAAGTSVGRRGRLAGRGGRLGRAARFDQKFDRSSSLAAGGGTGYASRVRGERHFNHRRGCSYFCGQGTSCQCPLRGFEHGDQHGLIAECTENGVAEGVGIDSAVCFLASWARVDGERGTIDGYDGRDGRDAG